MIERKEFGQDNSDDGLNTGTTPEGQERCAYSAPHVLSAEQLEAAAALCEGGSGGSGPGQSVPSPCGTLAS